MKKTPLVYTTLLLCMTIASTNASAELAITPPKISGLVLLDLSQTTTDTTETNVTNNTVVDQKKEKGKAELSSSGSRIILSGEQALNSDLKLNYSFGYNILLGQGLTSAVPRDNYIGLEHDKLGSVRVGRLPNYDYDIDPMDFGTPFGYSWSRYNNSIQYISPKWHNTQFKLHYSKTEGSEGGGTFDTFVNGQATKTNARNFISGNVLYDNEDKNLKLGVAYIHAGKAFNALTTIASVKPQDKLTLKLSMQRVDYNSPYPELGVSVGSVYDLSDTLALYTQAGHAKHYKGYRDGKNSNFVLELDKTIKGGDNELVVYGGLTYGRVTSFENVSEQSDGYNVGDLKKTQENSLGLSVGTYLTF